MKTRLKAMGLKDFALCFPSFSMCTIDYNPPPHVLSRQNTSCGKKLDGSYQTIIVYRFFSSRKMETEMSQF